MEFMAVLWQGKLVRVASEELGHEDILTLGKVACARLIKVIIDKKKSGELEETVLATKEPFPI